MCLYNWDYTINHNENEDERSHRHDIGLEMDTKIVNKNSVSI